MAKIRAVIFDVDGVLVDAKDWHYDALNRALGLFGYQISRYEHFVTYDGLPTRDKLQMLSKERGLPSGLHGFINELKQLYTTEMIHTRCRPAFQHQYALARLKALGYSLAVASNAVRATVELMMRKAGLDGYLDLMLSNQDITRAKPDPQIYLEAFLRLELPPEACLILEDNEHGIRAARASKAHLMMVGQVSDVSFDNIMRTIQAIEEGQS